MNTSLQKISQLKDSDNLMIIALSVKELKSFNFSKAETDYIASRVKDKQELIDINQYTRNIFIYIPENQQEDYKTLEACRTTGNKILPKINTNKLKDIVITHAGDISAVKILALGEGLALSNYQFLKYFKDADKKTSSLKKIKLHHAAISKNDVEELSGIITANILARTLVNEPQSFLTANQLSKEITKMGKDSGFKVDVFNKKKIETLKMGGLLAVNRGSIEPPTFNILEWKPKNAKNKKPYVFVGKGVVYDTGGLSLKPTAGSMDSMKSDMGGAAAVAGALYAIAKNKLPVHVIGLIPATDNRPGVDAYAPGDVITMHNGLTVEVLNTDAEGRMILADALSYAKNYQPELVIDLATLTGAAYAAVGIHATVGMGTADKKEMNELITAGNEVFERVVEFPFWEEYGDMLKSTIADMKNIGGRTAGAITAGKFLEHFTKDKEGQELYPWMHLDIAGPAFLESKDSYRGLGGSGVGVRLLYQFIKSKL